MPDAVQGKETGSDRNGAGAADPPSRAAPSLAILGTDALLTAQPATAVQLAHACLRIGYHAVVPASWGDELLAGGCLRHLASRRGTADPGPSIFCACPHVANRLLAVGSDLEPFLASFVAPPVAVARYLRALYAPTRIRLTYIGRCPGAADDAIDARLTPDELLAVLTERGVDLADQPRVFDSVIPPDRRRFLSQPGGLPSAEMIRRVDPDRKVVEVTGPELATELTQILLSNPDVMIDVATRLGCVCSGAVAEVAPGAARAGVMALEPPRSSSPVVDDRVPVSIELPLPTISRNAIDVVAAVAVRRSSGASRAAAAEPTPPADDPGGVPVGRRRSPTQGTTVRPHSGAVPTTRSGEGRALPRAYVARRNTGSRARGPTTPPRGEPQQLDASTAGDRAGNGGAPRGRGVPRAERTERAERAEPPMPTTTPPPAVGPPSGEMAVRAKEPALVAAVGAAPDRASDPHGESFAIAGETAVAEPARTTAAGPRGPSPISAETPARAATFGARTATLARQAVGSAQQRRALLAALLGVALLSASVGVLAGRWLAARTAAAAVR